MGAMGQDASRIRTHGEDVGAAIRTYSQGVDGVAASGDDGLFGDFVAVYAECRQMKVAALSGLSTEAVATGDGLHGVIRNTRDTEIANAANVGNIGDTWA
ncbi:hypothetical protein SAMN05421869_11019 [Nonomuraea jiangxiensis]|uniref:Excreted virulence factor EspC, type VII ESX diderm n=2 Tax=Nonomuraea jiangxiensis TaxID=633440 RepID=A0A1G8SZ33_9ACTN|nr:hypothetical protein SAMN05421869_11019 [Nonomuraea jiangxiensis]